MCCDIFFPSLLFVTDLNDLSAFHSLKSLKYRLQSRQFDITKQPGPIARQKLGSNTCIGIFMVFQAHEAFIFSKLENSPICRFYPHAIYSEMAGKHLCYSAAIQLPVCPIVRSKNFFFNIYPNVRSIVQYNATSAIIADTGVTTRRRYQDLPENQRPASK